MLELLLVPLAHADPLEIVKYHLDRDEIEEVLKGSKTTASATFDKVLLDLTPPWVYVQAYAWDGTGTSWTTVEQQPATVHVRPSQVLSLFGNGSDSSGIASVVLAGAFTISCSDGEFGRTTYLDLVQDFAYDPVHDGPIPPVGVGLAIADLLVPPMECPNGMTFTGGSGSFTTTATDASGLTATTAVLSLILDP